jgi:hypothetical protein
MCHATRFPVLSDGPRGVLGVVGFLSEGKLQRLLLREMATSSFISTPFDPSFMHC